MKTITRQLLRNGKQLKGNHEHQEDFSLPTPCMLVMSRKKKYHTQSLFMLGKHNYNNENNTNKYLMLMSRIAENT